MMKTQQLIDHDENSSLLLVLPEYLRSFFLNAYFVYYKVGYDACFNMIVVVVYLLIVVVVVVVVSELYYCESISIL